MLVIVVVSRLALGARLHLCCAAARAAASPRHPRPSPSASRVLTRPCSRRRRSPTTRTRSSSRQSRTLRVRGPVPRGALNDAVGGNWSGPLAMADIGGRDLTRSTGETHEFNARIETILGRSGSTTSEAEASARAKRRWKAATGRWSSACTCFGTVCPPCSASARHPKRPTVRRPSVERDALVTVQRYGTRRRRASPAAGATVAGGASTRHHGSERACHADRSRRPGTYAAGHARRCGPRPRRSVSVRDGTTATAAPARRHPTSTDPVGRPWRRRSKRAALHRARSRWWRTSADLLSGARLPPPRPAACWRDSARAQPRLRRQPGAAPRLPRSLLGLRWRARALRAARAAARARRSRSRAGELLLPAPGRLGPGRYVLDVARPTPPATPRRSPAGTSRIVFYVR